jgi:mannitol operon repressor
MLGFNAPPDYEPWESEDIQRMLADLARTVARENSERTVAIVCGADLEETLGELIRGFLAATKQAESLVNGSNFNRRIELAYGLGLISDDEYSDLHLIRDVRNHFAHKPRGASFNDPGVVEKCSRFRIPTKSLIGFEDTGATLFQSVTVVLLELLWARKIHASREQRTVPPEFAPSHWADL